MIHYIVSLIKFSLLFGSLWVYYSSLSKRLEGLKYHNYGWLKTKCLCECKKNGVLTTKTNMFIALIERNSTFTTGIAGACHKSLPYQPLVNKNISWPIDQFWLVLYYKSNFYRF